MGKYFRIMKGGRSLRKDGSSESRRRRSVGDPRYWPAEPRRDAQQKRRRSGSGAIWSIAPLTLSLSAAMFWGVWTLTAPMPAPTTGVARSAGSSDTESGSFAICHSGSSDNCVVDGDTFYYKGTKIRIADIDTPETHPPRCVREGELGNAATHRLHSLINAGPFSLENIDRDEDRYGRKLRVVTRGGESLGGILVDEGLARWYEGGRKSWC